MAFSADALMGILIGLMFFALGVTTTAIANKGRKVPSFAVDSNGEPVTAPVIVRDYPNIIFGSVFITLSVVVLVMAGRAAMS
jgi:hypothetical protein